MVRYPAKRFVVLLILLSFFVVHPLYARPEEFRKLENYLQEVHRHLQSSYAFPDDITAGQLLREGKKEVLRLLSSPSDDREGPPSSARTFLSDRLKDRELEDVDEFVQLLRLANQRDESARLDPLTIADAMASGMINGTGDPFSRIMTLRDIKELRKRLAGEKVNYSLGLHLRSGDNGYSVDFVQYRSAAYRAGIQAGDRVLSINKQTLQNLSDAERQSLLRAKFGETAEVRVLRDGWKKPVTFELRQHLIGAETVESKLLQNHIGYVRLTQFRLNASDRLESALIDLKKRGMEQIILDLRNNPGGALPEAVETVDLFLPGDQPITTVNSRFKLRNFWLRLIRKLLGYRPLSGTRIAEKPSPFETMEMVVLVNGSSASASELTAGALQDHDRATLIGRRTFGKGSGQVAIPLTETGGLGEAAEYGWFGDYIPSRFLYLTVLTYRLPSGRSIHKKGLRPDRRITRSSTGRQKIKMRSTLRRSDLLSAYISNQLPEQKERLRDLAVYDGFELSRYPEFDQLLKTVRSNLQSSISRSMLRQELRRAVRWHFRKTDEGKSFLVDQQADPSLQAGMLYLSDEMK